MHNNTTGIDIDDNTHACTLDACCAYTNTTGIRFAKCNDITSDCRTYANTNGVLFEDSTINAVAPIYPTNCFIGGRTTSNQIGINVLSVAANNVFGGTSTNNTLLNVTAGITRMGTLPGTVTSLASATIPDGWLLCDGTSLTRADYIDLFATIGTQFGSVDIDHFNIPDLRDRFIRGDDPGDARGFGTLQLDDIKSHDHPVTDAGLLKLATANPSINTYTSGSSIIGFESALYTAPSTGGTETRPINVNLSAIIKI